MLQWVGDRQGVEGLPGIPARDLSDDEVAQYGGEAALLASGLFERVSFEDFLKRMIPEAYEDHAKWAETYARVGVSLSPEIEAEIRRLTDSGDLAGAQKIILDELARWDDKESKRRPQATPGKSKSEGESDAT